MIFQDPMTSLNPVLTIGRQIRESLETHMGMNRSESERRATELLDQVGIPNAPQRVREYPHQFSGGMRQRAMIAMGLVTAPALIVADEPTTALDVTVQAQILDLLREVNRNEGTAILFISHDIAVVTELCERVIVMYAGRIVETVSVGDLRSGAVHPYTRALMATVVDLDRDPAQPLAMIEGRPAAVDSLEPGCPFAPRCPLAIDRCVREEPPLRPTARGAAACWVTVPPGPEPSPNTEVTV
jgi:oligopeptide/dipeptide ABC transporter ATP-binding protein